MKKQVFFLSMAAVLAIAFSSCKKDSSDPPSITTKTVSAITVNTATCGGDITSGGSSDVTARGVCWGTNANPTIADSKTTDGTGSGTFTSAITGLTPATLYHVRAYATNSEGTSYGSDVTFTTASLIKSISFYALWAGGTEKWEFTYDANSKVTKFDNFWEGSLDKTVTYDYSVSGKLTLTKNSSSVYGTYDIDANGHITKDDWGGGEYASYEYNTDGFATTYNEYWSGSNHKKLEIQYQDGNVSQITKFTDDGVASQIKVFTYTIGENTDGIFQANATDSDWKPIGNFYGKPNAKLVDYFEYWDPRETPIVKNRSSFTYTFDSKNRVSKAVKTLTSDGSTEEWSYTYAD